ncbi:MAG: AtpZ/AtpI family protein [Methanocellales archaeon]|nr:AtpZ/AtpI family protein [Methanocellales archaeon]MDD3291360.1 AtpZ/AtpI family protein [Methanocellales archaeon]MDD5234750.1 AtpZ/AtpI family protein [Methanocellales archaeon]MDD5484899.1 AtpZ/AtpI family protein [Methanocellales archaeon]
MPDTRIPQAFKAISVGTEVAFSVLGGGFLGYLIGKIFGEKWAAIGLSMGILLGFVGGMYNLIRKFW